MTSTDQPNYTVILITETHHDIDTHVVYARAGMSAVELDRFSFGSFHVNVERERAVIHEAMKLNYADHVSRETSTATTRETRVCVNDRADRLIRLKLQARAEDETVSRGQTIVAQIRAEREARRARAQARAAREARGQRLKWLTDPSRSIFA